MAPSAGIDDPTPTVVMDLSTRVHAVGDRGLLGLAVHPAFPATPYLYVTYILDAPVSGSPVPYYDDECPPSPNGAKDGCPAPGRLSRIQVGPDSRAVGDEQVLIGGQFWCHAQQGHALDHVAFGPDGALYVSSGDGAAGSFQDYGQHSGATAGVTPNACGDPPREVGERLTLPTTADVVHVATGRNFPDALAAAAAAGERGGPVLLVDRSAVPAATAAELKRLAPSQIVIVGGTSVISSAVESQLAP